MPAMQICATNIACRSSMLLLLRRTHTRLRRLPTASAGARPDCASIHTAAIAVAAVQPAPADPSPSFFSSPPSSSSSSSPPPFDLVVVGGGIVGLACARELLLRHPLLRVCVVEKEAALATHQSARNSGVIHAGIYYKPGSQRAQLCAVGAKAMFDYCDKHNLPVKKVGKLIVATHESELAGLELLHERGLANGVADLQMLPGSAIRSLEPNITGVGALLSPHTGVTCFPRVARSFADDFQRAGGEIRLRFELVQARAADRSAAAAGFGGASEVMELRSSSGATVLARHVLVCGGVYADRVASRVFGGCASPSVVPVRGTWLQLRRELVSPSFVRRNIYPVPDARFPFLGVHLTPTLDEQSGAVSGILVGPNAVLAASREGLDWTQVRARDVAEMLASPAARSLATRHLRFGAGQLAQELFPRLCALREIQKYAPALRWEHVESARPCPLLLPWLQRPVLRAGVRAQALDDDGRLEEDFVLEVQQRLGQGDDPTRPTADSHSPAPLHPRPAVVPAAILHVRNAPSPAATSALAIAARVADRAEQAFHW